MKLKKRHPPFVSIRSTLLGCRRIRNYPGRFLRVYLWGNAAYNAKPERGKPKLLLLHDEVPKAVRIERRTLTSAIEAFTDDGLLTIEKPPIRPGGPGSSGGARAAEYGLPQRIHALVASGKCRIQWNQGDPDFDGHWRIDCGDLRGIVRDRRLNDSATVVLVTAVLPQHRSYDGALDPDRIQPITARGVVELLARTENSMTMRTAERALHALEAIGLVEATIEAAGRRAARYLPAGLAAEGIPWLRKR
jgi:hypothetical protein